MERALDVALLREALGGPAEQNLPTAEKLQALMAESEVKLFTNRPDVPDELLATAWYLHGVASASVGLELYSQARQRRAFQVSAHIFDVALSDRGRPREERLRLGVAAQLGYLRGDLEPNSIAVYRRLSALVQRDEALLEHVATVALEAALLFFGLDRRRLFDVLGRWRQQFVSLRQELGTETLQNTIFAPAQLVVIGLHALLRYLAFGSGGALEQARESFRAARPLFPEATVATDLSALAPLADLDARWVAGHLESLSDDLQHGSVWAQLPPDLPNAARQAFTVTDPPILTLWEPQRRLLSGDRNPLSSEVRRVVLSVPTSSGKTLLAQLFMLSHLAREEGSVCYVAPLRSLGREVRMAIRTRVRLLQKELGRDLPDFAPTSLATLLEALAAVVEEPADIDIMTPERLAHMIRDDAEGVLERYSLFVFDEAHLLAERGRGFLLESVLSFLHWRTRHTAHRIVLLSAALGNRGQIMQWLDPEQRGVLFESDWRGPRRLHAIFNTRRDQQAERHEPVNSAVRPRRLYFQLRGELRLRPAEDATVRHLEFVDPVGVLAIRTNAAGGDWKRENTHSTPNYKSAARLVVGVGHGGPVLVVMSTRLMARRMAGAIAELVDPEPRARQLAEFVRLRLGSTHPLGPILARGVAYHHAALPTDVLESIEDGLRADVIRFVASTTTLTEGVNLPVRTIVIAETRYEGQPTEALIQGARLLNAVGRAGRACKESEGWVVLILGRSPSGTDFDLLRVGDEELESHSRLVTEEALSGLAELEAQMAAGEDAVFVRAAEDAENFLAFVWLLLAIEERRGRGPETADLAGALAATLGFSQATEAVRVRWTSVAEAVRHSYAAIDPERRRRWARVGTSIASARDLDTLVDDVVAAALETEERGTADAALDVLERVNGVERLLALPEAPRWDFRASAGGPTRVIAVDALAVLREWLRGDSLAEIADRYLEDVASQEFRIEQLVDRITEQFEHFMSWTLGVLVELANQRLATQGEDDLLSPHLPLFVRYGVNSLEALELLTEGIRSREFAQRVAVAAHADDVNASDLRAWIRAMTISEWRARFSATPSDLLDLLEFTRIRRSNLLGALLESGAGSFETERLVETEGAVDVYIGAAPGEPAPAQLVAFARETHQVLARVPAAAHTDVQAVLDTGIAVQSTLVDTTLTFSLTSDEG